MAATQVLPRTEIYAPLQYLDHLTEREFEVLGLIANGDSNQTIAGKLHIKLKTVEGHIAGIYSKLTSDDSVDKRVEAALMYREKYQFKFVRQQVEVSLTPREYEVLSLIANGDSNQTIAGKLYIELKTVESHIAGIYSKLTFEEGVDKRIMAMMMFDMVPVPSGVYSGISK